ncbi:very low-density lipoprotein receptor-like [Limulus polyphemus]|uniref:Very low-density lipoprotein receptor-like n=1 Tax=Limulus polyphemus TaxID=6850 RepID=A0ABM1B0F3_LIMPO|nr:very low-density lipoprotein receptor-like [Limulus polyphemus]
MNDHTSLTFLRMAAEVTKSLEELFFMSPLVRDYNATEIIGFRKGSVIVECRIFLNRPFTRAAEQVGLTFVQILEKGHGMLPTGSLHVDITSITFAGLQGVLTPPVDLKPITPPPSDAAWSPWGQWSSCNDLEGKCDSNRIHSRSRDCRTELGHGIRLLNNDPCRRKGGHEIEIIDCVCFITESSPSSSSSPTLSSIKSSSPSEPRNIQNVTTQEAISANEVVGESTSESTGGPCSHCQHGICIISVGVLAPRCVASIDPQDPRGCGGWCTGSHEICRQLDDHLYQCVDVSECHSEEWRCGDGLCVPAKRRCDGHFNCYDMTDEANCDCKEDEFHCGNDTSCLPVTRRCNGYIDCWDGSDEANCTTMCPSSQFTCNNGQCIPNDYFCDSYYDCNDLSDEPELCRASCLTHQQQCQNGRCVNHESWCDGVDNCGDNSDEQNCPLSTTITEE